MAATCRSCKAPIVFATTPNGQLMPLNEKPAADGTLFLIAVHGKVMAVHCDSKHETAQTARDAQAPRYVSHFATCPFAKQFRRNHA